MTGEGTKVIFLSASGELEYNISEFIMSRKWEVRDDTSIKTTKQAYHDVRSRRITKDSIISKMKRMDLNGFAQSVSVIGCGDTRQVQIYNLGMDIECDVMMSNR